MLRMAPKPRFGLKVALVLALATAAKAHSWIERAYKVAPNGTMIGAEGYARGWIARNSTDPPFQDSIPQLLLPVTGQSAYSGDEILNKYKKEENPQFPMLEAAPGDHIAIIHLENGHTTLPQNQPKKPQNRGTIFLYGTSQPRENERLFDVHLVWNKDGTGGDGRGVLLGTRNYDDGNCYQPNNGALSLQRAAELAPEGADHNIELGCQSTVQLPSDLKAGSIYTIYWYWDWPDLDASNIDFQATTNGLYPWAGTFMRGQKDPHGFTMAAISKNESYASTIDIKITGGSSSSTAQHANINSEFIEKQNIYSMAIKDQMTGNYQVDIDANGGGQGGHGSTPVTSTSAAPHVAPTTAAATKSAIRQGIAQPSAAPAGGDHEQQSTVWKTLYKTVSAESSSSTSGPVVFVTTTVHTQAAAALHSPSTTTITSTTTMAVTSTRTNNAQVAGSTVIVSVTKHVAAALGGEPTPTSSNGRPTMTPLNRRRNWAFGQH
ncbi:hypothetical protein TASIC1_0007015600 [Trichoderma asperellum]|uniref:DUF7492 domain-containing protein n=1 Tax=Trichoderma asperellum TaxID=101201 RepID=A0A6V8QVH9_TRIAP|nr:hypothetical protein TASIC1_0007015600 [Trichoderma asperellum]